MMTCPAVYTVVEFIYAPTITVTVTVKCQLDVNITDIKMSCDMHDKA